MRVLMVDDHVMFLQGLKNLLGVLAPELQVDTSHRLADALQLVQLTAYDLVLLDWHLAEHEGAQGHGGEAIAGAGLSRSAGRR